MSEDPINEVRFSGFKPSTETFEKWFEGAFEVEGKELSGRGELIQACCRKAWYAARDGNVDWEKRCKEQREEFDLIKAGHMVYQKELEKRLGLSPEERLEVLKSLLPKEKTP